MSFNHTSVGALLKKLQITSVQSEIQKNKDKKTRDELTVEGNVNKMTEKKMQFLY